MQVPSARTLLPTVHVRARLPHLSGEDLDRGLTHGQCQPDVPDHRSNDVGTSALTFWDIDGPAHGARARDHSLLPGRAEALASEGTAVRSGDSVR